MLSRFSCIRLFLTLWTIVLQAPLPMGFFRPEYWSGLPCPPPGDLPNPGIKPTFFTSPALAGGFFTIQYHSLIEWAHLIVDQMIECRSHQGESLSFKFLEPKTLYKHKQYSEWHQKVQQYTVSQKTLEIHLQHSEGRSLHPRILHIPNFSEVAKTDFAIRQHERVNEKSRED